jgi:hypothetical protein
MAGFNLSTAILIVMLLCFAGSIGYIVCAITALLDSDGGIPLAPQPSVFPV